MMAQLYFWTHRVNETQREEFLERFGFDIPEPLLDLYENMPEEYIEFFRFHSIERIIEEDMRPTMLMPGLVPFAEESEGDLYCFYLPWMDRHRMPPIGIWMNETNHFLPLTRHMEVFLMWWIIKEAVEISGKEDHEDLHQMLEVFQESCGLEELEMLLVPIHNELDWNAHMLRLDNQAAFSLTHTAMRQFALQGMELSFEMLKMAERALPQFGGSSIWQARLHAMQGRFTQAHDAYWRHLQTPMFANGYHYWWHIGDLQIPEISEMEAVDFLLKSDVTAPDHILNHPKVRFLQTEDPKNYNKRLDLAYELEKSGDYHGALVEVENAFFLQSWDKDAAQEMLETLLNLYPEHNRLHEAEQCRRTLNRLRFKASR